MKRILKMLAIRTYITIILIITLLLAPLVVFGWIVSGLFTDPEGLFNSLKDGWDEAGK